MRDRVNPHVLHIIDHTGIGGAQVVLRDIIQALCHRFAFDVAILGRSGVYTVVYRSLGVRVFELENHGGKWDPLVVGPLLTIIRNGEYDLVHAHLCKSMVLGALAPRLAGRPVILHDHSSLTSPILRQYFPFAASRWAYRQALCFALFACRRAIVLTPDVAESYVGATARPQARSQFCLTASISGGSRGGRKTAANRPSGSNSNCLPAPG